MALRYSEAVRNARLNAVETVIGTSPLLRIYTGSAPASTAAAATGTLLAECTLPSNWMADASGGTKAKAGTWEDTAANNDGEAGYFRIYDSGGTDCGLQGTVTEDGGGGDMEVDNVDFATGQAFEVVSFSLIAGNA
jgi:hypothetical protein